MRTRPRSLRGAGAHKGAPHPRVTVAAVASDLTTTPSRPTHRRHHRRSLTLYLFYVIIFRTLYHRICAMSKQGQKAKAAPTQVTGVFKTDSIRVCFLSSSLLPTTHDLGRETGLPVSHIRMLRSLLISRLCRSLWPQHWRAMSSIEYTRSSKCVAPTSFRVKGD